MSFFHPSRTTSPHLETLRPEAALPGGSFEVLGQHLGGAVQPQVFFGETQGALELMRPDRVQVRVPEGVLLHELTLRYGENSTNIVHANVGMPLADELHMVSNPAVDADDNLYAMVSGPRGTRVAVSVYRITPDLQVRPFVRDLLNVSALAFGPDGYLYASSRAEGTVYRISPEGAVTTFAEGMGIATGLAFDRQGNLYVGDRSGTIFRLGPHGQHNAAEIFVYATLEPSVAAYHLAFREDGVLLVTAPTTSSHHPIYAIDPDGTPRVFYQGLGRPQGMALDAKGNVYVAASLEGRRGIVRLSPEGHEAELVVSGNDLVGLCFFDSGSVALATSAVLYRVDLGIEGLRLV